jgi:hypothetical protein
VIPCEKKRGVVNNQGRLILGNVRQPEHRSHQLGYPDPLVGFGWSVHLAGVVKIEEDRVGGQPIGNSLTRLVDDSAREGREPADATSFQFHLCRDSWLP